MKKKSGKMKKELILGNYPIPKYFRLKQVLLKLIEENPVLPKRDFRWGNQRLSFRFRTQSLSRGNDTVIVERMVAILVTSNKGRLRIILYDGRNLSALLYRQL